jgi:hypothetical protein
METPRAHKKYHASQQPSSKHRNTTEKDQREGQNYRPRLEIFHPTLSGGVDDVCRMHVYVLWRPERG